MGCLIGIGFYHKHSHNNLNYVKTSGHVTEINSFSTERVRLERLAKDVKMSLLTRDIDDANL